MPYKPMPPKIYEANVKSAGWNLKKGKIDWNLYDDNNNFVCTIKISHGSRTKSEVIAPSVKRTEQEFKKRGLIWPPKKK
jgi:hypothetical protein